MVSFIKWIVLGLLILFVLYRLPLRGIPPQEMVDKAKEIDMASKDRLELVKNVYDFINQSYTSPVRQYLQEPNKIFMKGIKKIWQSRGEYMPSHIQNEMAKQMLLMTGKFSEDEFEMQQEFCQISPHTYISVKINQTNTIALDLWGADHSIPFGCYTTIPCGEGQAICP